MKGLFSRYETAEANTKPLDSIAATLLKLNFFDFSTMGRCADPRDCPLLKVGSSCKMHEHRSHDARVSVERVIARAHERPARIVGLIFSRPFLRLLPWLEPEMCGQFQLRLGSAPRSPIMILRNADDPIHVLCKSNDFARHAGQRKHPHFLKTHDFPTGAIITV